MKSRKFPSHPIAQHFSLPPGPPALRRPVRITSPQLSCGACAAMAAHACRSGCSTRMTTCCSSWTAGTTVLRYLGDMEGWGLDDEDLCSDNIYIHICSIFVFINTNINMYYFYIYMFIKGYFYICMCICLSVWLSLSGWLAVCLFVCIYLSIYRSMYLSIYLPRYLPRYLFVLCIYLSNLS